MKKMLCCVLLLLFGSNALQGQTIPQKQGKPFIQVYDAKTYGGYRQIWSIVQDKRGLMYFGHDRGLVEYDGVSWRKIAGLKGKRVRSMNIDKQGVIYVGSAGDFGYLTTDKSGVLRYVSLRQTLPKNKRNFSDIWKVVVAGNKVYFVAMTQVFCYQNKKLYKIYETSKKHFYHLSFGVYNQLYQPVFDKGIALAKADSLQLIKGSSVAGKGRFYVMLPYRNQKILMLDSDTGFWLYDLQSGTFNPFAPQLEKVLPRKSIYCGVALPKGHFAFGTRTRGVVIIDQQGQIVNIIDKSKGLPDNTVWEIYYQAGTQNLWVGTDRGIAKVTIDSPLEQFDASQGLEGTVEGLHRFRNKLYVATSVGAFCFDKGRFTRIKGLSSQTWNFLNYKVPNTNQVQLLVGNNRGAYALKDSIFSKIISDNSIFRFHVDRTNPYRLYCSFLDGLGTRVYKQGKWEIEQKRFKGLVDPPRQLVQDKDNKIWVVTRYKGVGLLENNQVTMFDSTAGLSPKNVSIVSYNHKLYYTTNQGTYIFDPAKRHFKPDQIFDKLLNTSKVTYADFDSTQTYWMVKSTASDWYVPYFKKGNRYLPDSLVFKPVYDKEIDSYTIEPNGVYWLGTNEGLFRYDSHQHPEIRKSFTTLIRKVQTSQDSLLFAGNKLTTPPILAYANNSLVFDYAALYFSFTNKTEYSYQLVGYEKGWSKWTRKTQKEYTNLNEGNYTFRVKSRNIYDVKGSVASYSFKILPPWHRTWWAYTLFGVLTVVILWGSIKWYTTRLRRQKAVLEHKVMIRTQEVVAQKEEISLQNNELLQQSEELQQQSEEIMAQHDAIEETNMVLSRQNIQIKQSIKSAETIQSAILPFSKRMQALLDEYFVLFRPRDIVSGDFYFLEEMDNKTIVAAIDCTGHGVPGAFMSLIGYALLNDIIIAKQKTDPAEILEMLRAELKYSLKQDQTGKKNGMDVAMVTLEHTQSTKVKILFAGAKRPLWYTTTGNNEIQQIKGSSVSIGVDYEDNRQITSQELWLDKGAVLYLGTDGLADQNDRGRRKFGSIRLLTLLAQNSHLPLARQQATLEKTLDNFMLGTEQRDDILLLGVRL